MTFSARLSNLRKEIENHQLDGYAIVSFEGSDYANLRYMTGFGGTFGIYWVTLENDTFFTDSRYLSRAKSEQPHLTVEPISQWAAFGEVLKSFMHERVGLNAHALTVAQFQKLQQELNQETLVPCDDLVAQLRQVKDENEIAAIQRAQSLTDQTFDHMLGLLKPGLSEEEAAWEMEVFLRKNGADELAFPVMAASGQNSALPHHHTGSRKLQEGEFVLFDFGAKIDGYCADMTRTVFLGTPSDKHKEVYQIVLKAQQACLDHLKANMSGKAADKVTRDIIAAEGYSDHFGHSTGHSIGLEVHESPGLSPLRDGILPEKAVVSVEPGIYIEGWGGVRIEDLVVIEKDGVTNLTKTPKELLCL